MAEIIAERPIFATVNGSETQALVRLWKPLQTGAGDWSCRFTFQTDSEAIELKDGAAGGVDAMQALIEPFHGVAHRLDRSGIEWSMFSEETLRSDVAAARTPIDDGFPRAGLSVMFLGTPFRKRMEAYVENAKAEAHFIL
jgi:hypothetical protein